MINNQRPDVQGGPTKKLKPISRTFRALAACGVLTMLGCGGGTDTKDLTSEQGKQVFSNRPVQASTDPGTGEPAESNGARPAATAVRAGWAVVVCTFNGKDAQKNASTGLARARRDAGLADAYLETRSDGVAVLVGDFADPASKAAKEALVRVRTAKVGRTTPFDGAIMVPPPVGGTAGGSPYDLRTVRRQFDEKTKDRRNKPTLSTLLIAFYGPTDGRPASASDVAETRKLAEQTVAKLRADGDEAYFFHGPKGSNITVGLFENNDVDGPVMGQLRKKYPTMLVNGAGMKMTTQVNSTEKKERLQPTTPVEVPR